MGQKFILSEQEKLRIKSLYENTNPPNEFEVVGFVNPFRDTKYLPYAKIKYSKELKDGDFFYDLHKIEPSVEYYGLDPRRLRKQCITDFQQKIKNDFSYLVGKTVRGGDDSIKKIKSVEIFLYNSNTNWASAKLRNEFSLDFDLIQKPEDIIQVGVYVNYDEGYGGTPQKLRDEINSKLPTIQAKDLPDCLFELKRVKRIRTDYKP